MVTQAQHVVNHCSKLQDGDVALFLRSSIWYCIHLTLRERHAHQHLTLCRVADRILAIAGLRRKKTQAPPPLRHTAISNTAFKLLRDCHEAKRRGAAEQDTLWVFATGFVHHWPPACAAMLKRPLAAGTGEPEHDAAAAGEKRACFPEKVPVYVVNFRQQDTFDRYDEEVQRATGDPSAVRAAHEYDDLSMDAHGDCLKVWSFETLSGTRFKPVSLPPSLLPLVVTPPCCQAPTVLLCPCAGGRRFVVASLGEFWKRLLRLAPRDRHFYEIIRESTPCRLYFDLEYQTALNPGVDGDAMLEAFLGHVALHMMVRMVGCGRGARVLARACVPICTYVARACCAAPPIAGWFCCCCCCCCCCCGGLFVPAAVVSPSS